METEKITVAQLKIGDVVKLNPQNNDSFQECTVVKVDDNEVKMVRPYLHLGDFTYTGGVIPYIGMETILVPRNWHTTYTLLDNIYRGE